MELDTRQLWQAILGELELRLSKANFMTWFKNTFISSFNENERELIIGVPNTFTKAWLEKKYHSVILQALEKITENKVKKIFFRVETTKTYQLKEISQKEETAIKITETVEAPSPIKEMGLNSKYVFSNFVIGKGNELAQAACLAITNQPGTVYNPLFIYGGVGLGKTHLLQAVGNRILETQKNKKIICVSCEKFTNDFIKSISSNKVGKFKEIYRSADVLLIDDIQFLAGKESTQEEFFHTFDALHQNNRQIMITSDRPPKALASLEQRLISRFEWGMIADVSAPDLETRTAILETKCKEKGYSLDREILNYLALVIQNNVRELEGALNKLIAYQQLNNEPVNLEKVKKIMSALAGSSLKKSLTPKKIISAVATYYDLSLEDLLGSCRKKNLTQPRQIVMYLMREELKSSYPAIGQEIGNRDHTTAMYAYLKISKEAENDEKISQDINLIKQRLYNG